MSTLFKKVTSAISVGAIVASTVGSSIVAAASGFLPYAEALADAKVITKQANEAGYRLADNALRQEVVAMAVAASKATSVDTCAGKFSDVSATKPNSWVCKVAETALAKGLIAANATFRPEAKITRAEALAMILKGQGIEIPTATKSSFNDVKEGWQVNVAEVALAKKIISANASFRPSDLVTRGELFVMAANAAGLEIASDDLNLDDLFGDDTSTGTTSTGTTSTGTTTVVKAGDLTITLAPSSPAAATVPYGANVEAARFDLTAGSADITISSVTITRKGISDTDTIDNIAGYINGTRATKVKDDSLSDNTQASLTMESPLVIKAGSTVTLSVVAETQAGASGDEFALELADVASTAANVVKTNAVGATFKVGNVQAASLTVDDESTIADVKVGEQAVKVAELNLENNANDEKIIVSSMTLYNENAADLATAFSNYVIKVDGVEAKATTSVNGDYLGITFTDGLTIGDSNDVTVAVYANVIGEPGKSVKFVLDSTSDIIAKGTKFGFGVMVTDSFAGDALTIGAGRLTIVAQDAPSTDIREDKDDVVFGKLVVTNVAGKNLELQKFAVKLEVLSGSTTITGSTILDKVELYNETNGGAYDLDLVGTSIYKDAKLSINLPQGTTTFAIRADIKADIANFDQYKVKVSLATGDDSIDSAGAFYVEETDEDTEVTDITPSSLSFKQLTGSEASAKVSNTPLADITIVKGKTDVVAMQFDVEAEEAFALKVDKVTMTGSTTSAVGFDKDLISEVKLYKSNVTDANLLDTVPGTEIDAGAFTFEGFTVSIAGNTKESFIAVASFVDADTATGSVNFSVSSVSIKDDENDRVTARPATATSDRDIAITGEGEITVAYDSNNTENKDPKTLLAGTSEAVVSYDIEAVNESVDVETVKVTLSGTGLNELNKAVATATLYLDGKEIKTNSNSDITNALTSTGTATIEFKNLTTLIIPEVSSVLSVKLNTNTEGYQKVGSPLTNVVVSKIELTDADGVSSGDEVADSSSTTSSKAFSIAPSTVTPSVTTTFNSSTEAKVKLYVNAGSNTQTGSNTKPAVTVSKLIFANLGNTTATGYSLYYEGDSSTIVTGSANGSNVEFDLSALTTNAVITDEKTYVIKTTAVTDKTYSLKLLKTGVEYSVSTYSNSFTTNTSQEQDLGSRSY